MSKVAVVDDDIEIRDVIKKFLEDAGHQVRGFFDGAPFLASGADRWADVIISDIQMPVGAEDLLRELRVRRSRVPFLAIGANVTREHAIRLLEYGAVQVLKKPFSFVDLLDFIEQLPNKTEDRNPQTGREIAINSRHSLVFRPSKVLVQTLN